MPHPFTKFSFFLFLFAFFGGIILFLPLNANALTCNSDCYENYNDPQNDCTCISSWGEICGADGDCWICNSSETCASGGNFCSLSSECKRYYYYYTCYDVSQGGGCKSNSYYLTDNSCTGLCDSGKCSGGSCVPACTSHYTYSCYNKDVYWYDSCGNREGKKEECNDGSGWYDLYRCDGNQPQRRYWVRGCSGGSCYTNTNNWSDWGSECPGDYCDWPPGSPYCYNNNVYQDYSCHDAGCSGGSCYDNPYTDKQLIENCNAGSYWTNDYQCSADGRYLQRKYYVNDCYNNDCRTRYYWDKDYQDCGTNSWTNEYRCSDSMRQRKAHYKGCSEADCYDYYGWQDYDDCSDCSCSCGGYNVTESTANGNCSDGKDNDCDGKTDSADSGCATCSANCPSDCSGYDIYRCDTDSTECTYNPYYKSGSYCYYNCSRKDQYGSEWCYCYDKDYCPGTYDECTGSGCKNCAPPTGTIDASKTTVIVGEEFTITITGRDDNDVYYITYNEGSNSWNDGNKQKCSWTQTKCTRSWDITENTGGTYTYYGWVEDSDNSGGHGCAADHKAGIDSVTVTVTQVDLPTVSTKSATDIGETSAKIRGYLDDGGGESCRAKFEYGKTSSYGSNTSWSGYIFETGDWFSSTLSLSRGERYHFKAWAENGAGTDDGFRVTFFTLPAGPSSLTATAISSSQIDLDWPGASTADYYIVRRKTTGYPTSPSDGSQACYTSSSNCSDTGLSGGTTYYYSVFSRAEDEGYYQYNYDSYASDWATTFTGACSSLNYPNNKWQRVWYKYDPGSGTLTNCIGDGPDESSEEFDTENIWDAGNLVGGYKDDHIGFKSSRSIYFKSSGYYHICAGSDDGINIWLDKDGNGFFSDDEWIFKRWQNRSYAEACAFNVKIEGAGYHKVRLDYYENTHNARVSFDLPSRKCIGECGSRDYGTWGSGCLNIIAVGCNTACAQAGYCPGDLINKYGCGASAYWGPYGIDIHCCCCNYAFELSTSPSSGSVGPGDSISTTVTFSRPCAKLGECDFSASGLPSGATVSFNPAHCKADWPGIPSCSSEMTISTASYTPLGAYPITIINTHYAKDNTEPTTYFLTVTEPKPDLVITSGWDAEGTIRYTIVNQGAGDAGESYTALYIKDTTNTWVYRANDYEGSLSAGSSRSGANQSFPSYTLSDRATDCAGRAEMPVSVCADYYNPRVDESNEDNNCYEFPVGCDTTPPTTEIKIKRNATDVTRTWLKADTYTIEFEDHDQVEGSGLNCENCTCEYFIDRCDINGSNCTTSIVPLTARDCNGSVNINAGTSPYDYQGLKRYKINSKVTDQAGNEGFNYEHLNFDFEAPTTE